MGSGENLKRLRLAAKLSQAALSQRAGVPQSMISDLETGRRKSTTFLPELAQALAVPVHEIDDRFDSKSAGVDGPLNYRPPPEQFGALDLPLYSSAEGGDGALIIDNDPIDHIARPLALRNISGAYAILVTGESMAPAFKPGQRAWVNPRLPWMKGEEHIYRQENNLTGEWRALIKEMVDWDRDRWIVRQHNPSKDYELNRREWQVCHRVVGRINRE